MKRSMFDPSDTYPDNTSIHTRMHTRITNAPFVKMLVLRNIPRNIHPEHTPIQTGFFDHSLAGNAHSTYPYDSLEGPQTQLAIRRFFSLRNFELPMLLQPIISGSVGFVVFDRRLTSTLP